MTKLFPFESAPFGSHSIKHTLMFLIKCPNNAWPSFLSTRVLGIWFLLSLSCSPLSNEEYAEEIVNSIKKRSKSIEFNVNAQNSFLTPLFIAHRGCRAFGPENSIPAFIGAGKLEMWAIETDFRITLDSVVVCMHDETIDATTNGSGKVSDYTYEELLAFRLKKEAFNNRLYRYENLSQKELQIPTMDEYLDICQMYGCIPFIELKCDNGVLDKMIEAINVHGLEGKCIISSSNLSLLKELREKGCTERIHHIFSSASAIYDLLSLGNAGLAFSITDMYSDLSNQYIYETYNPKTTKELVEMCHQLGLHVCFGAVDNNTRAIESISIGLDYMPTNLIWSVEI